MKEIKNVALYNSIENGVKVTKSCVFYTDGSAVFGNREFGIKAIQEVAKSKNITSNEQLNEIINKDTIYIMKTEEEFKKKYIPFLLNGNAEEVKSESAEKEEVVEEHIPGIVEVYADDERKKYQEPDDDYYDEDEIVYEEEYDPYTGTYTSFNETTQEETSSEDERKDVSGCLGLVAGVLVIGLGIAGVTLLASRCSRKSIEGTMNSTTSITTTVDDNTTANTTETSNIETTIVNPKNNDLYDDYNYAQLLNVTNNEFQKTAMINLGSTLTSFNGKFADSYKESGHDIKAALSFDEMVALQQAYNSYSVADVRAYFNGYEVDATDMSIDYKSASLQLMGAYIIESKEHPVDMTNLIDSQEGKEFYNKYHKAFLAAKEATGAEQLRLVNELYKMVREDFPVTSKVRTEGISHSEKHKSIKDYQLAVTPMIAASEMLFQNLKLNYTLNNMEVNFINDIGLCNYADDKFERIETIMLGAYEDNENPLYIQYRNAIITELTKGNKYVIDDAHRELSNLRRFQEIVNGDALYKYRNAEEKAKQNGENRKNRTTKRTYTKTTTKTRTDTKTRDGGPIPSDKKAEIDKKTDDANKKAKEEAEKKAKEEAARQQAEEAAKKKAIQESIAKENEKKKKEAEDKAKQNPSVKNVSPSSGPKQTLPDPNEYGKNFDDRVKVKTK